MTENKILKAKQQTHSGRWFGALSSGGTVTVGNLQLEFVKKDNSKFVTVQIFEYGLDETPDKQSWVKTKVVKETVVKEVPQQELLFDDDKVETESVDW